MHAAVDGGSYRWKLQLRNEGWSGYQLFLQMTALGVHDEARMLAKAYHLKIAL